MRIVVFSDSHRDFGILRRIVMSQPSAGIFLHLGDGEKEFEDLKTLYPEKVMLGVAGNCDWGSTGKLTELLEVESKVIFFAHGHTFGVKGGLDTFLRTARDCGADIALFGHTHLPYTGYEDGLYIMNPGSVSHPKDGPASYGVVDITKAGIVTRIIRLYPETPF